MQIKVTINKVLIQKFILFLLISFLIKPVWLFDIPNLGESGDDLSYWLHASTLAFDQDIDYSNDHNFDNYIFNNLTDSPSHPPGSGYISSVFVFLFNLIDRLLNINVQRINPIGTFSYFGYFFATQLFFLLSFYFLNKLFNFYGYLTAKKILLLITFLSTLVHYSTTRFLMSHTLEFFLVVVILFILGIKNQLNNLEFRLLLLVFFLLAITRPSTFIISIVLLAIYRSKFSKNLFFNLINVFYFFTLIFIYGFISRKLYNSSTILLNLSQNETTKNFVTQVNFENLLFGYSKLFDLMFSFSGGILWTTPIIFFGFVSFLYNALIDIRSSKFKIFDFILKFLYVQGFFVVALIWQGQEVAYGQRLFIGLLPFFSLEVGKSINKSDIKISKYTLIIKSFLVSSYIHYLYLYSSKDLTLKPGINLWGKYLPYVMENYTKLLFINLFEIKNIMTILVKSIYSINILGLIKFDEIEEVIDMSFLSYENLLILQDRSLIYWELNYGYIFLVTLTYFISIYFYLKIIYNDQ